MVYAHPLEGMVLRHKISLLIGGSAAIFPFIYTTILKNAKLKKAVHLRIGVISVIFFVAGIFYGYYTWFSQYVEVVQYLHELAVRQDGPVYYYFVKLVDFPVQTLTIFGIIFQMPLIVVLLVRYNLVKLKTLTYHIRPLVYVGFFILGLAITPPEIFDMPTLLRTVLSLILFFEISLIVARIIGD